ncbi:hypothetical protein LBMAG27_15790 [Bacteroidota bacterium]|nr:hypothetical protein LBMAG27_15790 [Bacteroidota bacterium]
MIKYLLLILTITKMSQCNQTTSNSPKHELKIYFATAQSWSGGAMGSGKGTNYLFYLSPPDSSYSFDSVWVNGYRLSLKKRNDYSSKDTMVLAATAFFPGSKPAAPEGETEKKGPDEAVKPCFVDASIVIRYFSNNTKFYLSSSSLKVLPKINYP